MKFWLLVILGAMAVTLGATALSVLNPNMKRPVVKTEPKKALEGPQPRFQLVGPQEYKHERVPQHQKGVDLFEIKNAGDAELLLQAGKTSCTCTDLYFSKTPVKLSDPAPAENQLRNLAIAPGATAFAVARWDSKDKGGLTSVQAKILSSDRLAPELVITVSLDIVQDLVMSSEVLSMGNFDQGQAAQAMLQCVAPVADQVVISDVETTAAYLKATVEPIPAGELPALGGKSGQRIVVTAGKDTPIGNFQEQLRFKTKVNDHADSKSVTIRGVVSGDLQIVGGEAKLDFQVVDAKGGKPLFRLLRANKPPPGGDLKLGAVLPENAVTAKLVRKGVQNNWMLEVSVKPDAPAGTIPGGKITVLDGLGNQAVAFVVVGVVNP